MADPSVLEDVRAVLETHKNELIEKYSAEGVAIGQGEDGEGYAIVVYLLTKELVRSAESVDGVPVRLEVVGEFRAFT